MGIVSYTSIENVKDLNDNIRIVLSDNTDYNAKILNYISKTHMIEKHLNFKGVKQKDTIPYIRLWHNKRCGVINSYLKRYDNITDNLQGLLIGVSRVVYIDTNISNITFKEALIKAKCIL